MIVPPLVPFTSQPAPYAGTTLHPGIGLFAWFFVVVVGLILGLTLAAAVAGLTELLDATRPWRLLRRPMEST